MDDNLKAALMSAIAETMQLEGTWYNNPDDPGGPTMYGLAWNKKRQLIMKHGFTTPESMKSMTLEQAHEMYAEEYSDNVVLKYFSTIENYRSVLFEQYFDTMVNQGEGTACRILQTALNMLGSGLAVDGRFGPATQRAMESQVALSVVDFDTKLSAHMFLRVFQAARVEAYCNLFRNGREGIKGNYRFLNSWLRRTA